MKKDNRIFRAKEVKPEGRGWIIDLSPKSGPVNPDKYFNFSNYKVATEFTRLIDSGSTPEQAIHTMFGC